MKIPFYQSSIRRKRKQQKKGRQGRFWHRKFEYELKTKGKQETTKIYAKNLEEAKKIACGMAEKNMCGAQIRRKKGKKWHNLI